METQNKEKYSDGSSVKMYLITLSKAAEISGYTPEHLNLLCRKGSLKGKKIGRNWHTTKEWLDEFLLAPSIVSKRKYRRRKNGKLIKAASKISSYSAAPQKQNEEQQLEEKISTYPISDFYLEDNKQREEVQQVSASGQIQKPISWLKIAGLFIAMGIFSFFIFSGIAFWRYEQVRQDLLSRNIPMDLTEDSFLVGDNLGMVQGEETVSPQTVALPEGSISASENYKMKQFSFGGTLVASANADNLALEIYDIRSETFATKDGKAAQMLVSWKTNKLAVSEISYGRNNSENKKTLQEKFYGFNHNVVFTKMDLATTYIYNIKARDKWGNELSSDNFGAYTGSKMVSVFDLIIKAISETFGWVTKQ